MPDPALTFWTAVLALTTFLVAIVAVGGEALRDALHIRPRLVLTLNTPLGELANVQNDSKGQPVWRRYYHLRVSNRRKGVTATNVKVVVTEIYKLGVNGQWERQPLSSWLTLRWQPGQLEENVVTGSVGHDLICNLGFLDKSYSRFELDPRFSVSPFVGFITAGQYMKVPLLAVTDIRKSNQLHLIIHWDGAWADSNDEMAAHLSIRESRNGDTVQ